MSLSVNHAATTQTTQTTSVAGTHKHHHLQTANKQKTGSASTDSIEFSEALQMYMAGGQANSPEPTGNYDANAREYSLSIDQKKRMLTDIQTRLADEASSTNETDEADALASLQDELSGYDADSITDDQASDLFDQVMETLHGMRPERPDGPPPGDRPDRPDGPPPEMTTDQMKDFLTALQGQLTGTDSSSAEDSASDASDPSIQSTWSKLLAELNSFDSASASDDEISDLFQEVIQAARQEQNQPSRVESI